MLTLDNSPLIHTFLISGVAARKSQLIVPWLVVAFLTLLFFLIMSISAMFAIASVKSLIVLFLAGKLCISIFLTSSMVLRRWVLRGLNVAVHKKIVADQDNCAQQWAGYSYLVMLASLTLA